MNGKILDYIVKDQKGIISSDDGRRLHFAASEWKSDDHPRKGQNVDFVENEAGVASEIYLSSRSSGGDSMSQAMKSGLLALGCSVLAFFIPVIGIVLSVIGLIFGRKARAQAKVEGDDTASTVGMIAIIISVISLIFTVLGLLTIMSLSSGLGLMSTM